MNEYVLYRGIMYVLDYQRLYAFAAVNFKVLSKSTLKIFGSAVLP